MLVGAHNGGADHLPFQIGFNREAVAYHVTNARESPIFGFLTQQVQGGRPPEIL